MSNPAVMMLRALACLMLCGTLASARKVVLPDHATARKNSKHIFNAIDSAGRQWGSAIHHNGFSFIPTVIPKGTLLYHGGQSSTPPPTVEWMAFEVEHAEAFAFSQELPPSGQNERATADDQGQIPLHEPRSSSHNETRYERGYLQTYRAYRDVNVLYLDGMSAGKTWMGTLDTQDLVLRENQSIPDWGPSFGERERSAQICSLLADWGYDGLMRAEIGFEIMYCDFSSGVDLVAVKRSSIHQTGLLEPYTNIFQWSRAVAERYDGLGGDRVSLDFSSLVSCYFFPINMSNPDPERPDLHRLASASIDELKDIKSHVKAVATTARRFTVNWQAAVDLITARYAKRLAVLTNPDSPTELFKTELTTATQTYIDASPEPGDINKRGREGWNETRDALLACEKHYLLPTYLDQNRWGAQDWLIHTALRAVMSDICSTFFLAKSVTDQGGITGRNHDAAGGDVPLGLDQLREARTLFEELKKRLNWSTWRRPQLCRTDEVLLTAMWPWGSDEDHWNPECRKHNVVHSWRGGYWKPDWRYR